MILPEDTKEPIYSDDEYEYNDNVNDDDEEDYYPYGGEYRDEDIQLLYTNTNTNQRSGPGGDLGPAPPYTPHYAPIPAYSPPTFYRRWAGKANEQSRRRRIGAIVLGGLVWTVLVVSLTGWMRYRGRHGDAPPRFHKPPSGYGGNVPDQRPADDGIPLGCVVWDDADWTSFPKDGNLPHLPSADRDERMWSVNRTFLLPASHPGQLFSHLFGPAAIGNIFLDTYDGNSTEIFQHDKQDRVIDNGQHGHNEVRQGEYVRVVVEPIITTLLNEGVAESTGLKILQKSQTCLMERGHNRTNIKRDHGDGPPPPPNERDGLGVGIYTTSLPDEPHRHGNPLQFRLHVSLPTASASGPPPSLVQGVLNALSGNHHSPPAHLVRSLDVRSGSGGVYVSDLSSAMVGEMSLENGVGEIELERLRAETLKVKTAGLIKGFVEISNVLDAETPVGEIDLNVTVAARPEFSVGPPGDHGPSGHGDVDACDDEPVSISLRSASGTVKLGYVDWEEPCRKLSQNLLSVVGTIEVSPHPLFEGPFTLSSALGEITVDLPVTPTPDPLGEGRERHITLKKRDRLGSKLYQGEVKWEGADLGDKAASGSNEVIAKRPGHGGPGREPPVQAGLEAKTQMGTIHVVF